MVAHLASLDRRGADTKSSVAASTKQRRPNPPPSETAQTNQHTQGSTVSTMHLPNTSTPQPDQSLAATYPFKTAHITSPHRATTATTILAGRHHPSIMTTATGSPSTKLSASEEITASHART